MLNQAWLIVANANAVLEEQLVEYAKNRAVLVCDGAYKQVAKCCIHIDILLGDFDSIDATDLQLAYAKNDLQVIAAPDQTKTDLQKAIEYIDALQPLSIVVLNALGQRADQSLYNFALLSRYYLFDRPIYYVNCHEKICFCKTQQLRLTGRVGACVSLFGFAAARITTIGLKYDVTDYLIKLNEESSVSNELKNTNAVIEVTER